MSVFQQARPSRIRIDTDSALAVDVVVPCFVALYPHPDDANKIAYIAVVQTPEQLAELTAALIRQATASGVMNTVLRSLTSSPSQIALQQYPPNGPDTPPDDLPAHLRKK